MAAFDRADPLLGSTIAGAYRVDELIARGGMALVYRGKHLRLEQPVAIKVQRWPVEEASNCMVVEARIHAQLCHPHIVAVRGLVVGTLPYVAPEHRDGSADPEPRSGIYSFGVCYQMVCGALPFSETSGDFVVKPGQDPPPPRSVAPHVSRLLERVILRSIAPRRGDRYLEVSHLRAALRVALEHACLGEARQGSRPGRQRAAHASAWPIRLTEARRLDTPATVDGRAVWDPCTVNEPTTRQGPVGPPSTAEEASLGAAIWPV